MRNGSHIESGLPSTLHGPKWSPRKSSPSQETAHHGGSDISGKRLREVYPQVKSESHSVESDMDSMVHGILQARILEWVAYPFSRGSSQPRDWTQVSCLVGGFFTSWATREAKCLHFHNRNVSTSCKDICQARPSHSCSSSLCSPWRCQKNQGVREEKDQRGESKPHLLPHIGFGVRLQDLWQRELACRGVRKRKTSVI